MIKKKLVRKKNIDEEGRTSTSREEAIRHLSATKTVQAWYNKHPDTSVYSKKFNHKKQTQHQEDL